MQEEVAREGGNRFVRFIASPLRGKYLPPMTQVGDYLAAAGILLFVIAVFGLDWISVGIKDVLGIGKVLGVKSPQVKYGLFVSPWAWGMVVVLVVMIAGLWFVQTRGGITLGAGIYCLIFEVIFFLGAWYKINSIIGNVVKLAQSVPIIGQALGLAVSQIAKELLVVHVGPGYWLFIPTALLLIVGGALRLASKPRSLTSGEQV
jgi:hypothetical protein